MTQPVMTRESAETAARFAASLDDDGAAFQAAAERIGAYRPTHLVTIARGSSDHAAEYAGRLAARSLGLLPASLPPSLVTVAKAPIRWTGALALAVSQSGASPDLVAPLRAARAGGALTVALVNAPGSPLAEAADIALPIAAGPEHAVAATKSVALAMLQSARLVALLARDDRLSEALSAFAQGPAPTPDWSAAIPDFVPARAMFVTGRGLGFSAAREAALKLKEVCGVAAEAVTSAEIMHGPKAVISPGDPLLAFGDRAEAAEAMRLAVDQLGAIGARVRVVGDDLGFAAPRDSRLDPIAQLLAFFPFCAALARARGMDPDAPRNLNKVTKTL